MIKVFRYIVFTIILVTLLTGAYLHVVGSRLPESTVFDGVQIGGMKHDEAEEVIAKQLEAYNAKMIRIITHDEKKEFLPADLGIYYDAKATLKNIVDATHIFKRLVSSEVNASDEAVKIFEPVVDVNEEKLSSTLKNYLALREIAPTDATLALGDNGYAVIADKHGKRVLKGEFDRLKNSIIASIYPFEDKSFEVTYVDEPADIQADQLSRLLEKVKIITAEPIILSTEDNQEALLLTTDRQWLAIDTKKQTVSLNEAFAKKWVKDFTLRHNREAGKWVVDDINEYKSEYDGKVYKRAVTSGDLSHGMEVDGERLIQDIADFVREPREDRVMKVSSSYTEPKIISKVAGYQFNEKLSRGISTFRLGNYENRVANIKLGLSQFDGIVLEPGEEFSFDRITGWITPQKGYKEALVLFGGVAAADTGGGVCQVSTTVFRSAVNLGLKIVERYPHSADVVYYHEYGYGLDAAIYPVARKDLRFINDTASPILIHTYTTPKEEAIVELYGTSDGRKVELTEVNTGIRLYKKWLQLISWGDREEKRTIESRYPR
jgi:vancomycin resistance protein YoaR